MPAGDSELLSDSEDFVTEGNLFFRAGYFRPVVEDRLAATERLEKGRDLVGAVIGVKFRGCLRVAAFPCAAIGFNPLSEERFVHDMAVVQRNCVVRLQQAG